MTVKFFVKWLGCIVALMLLCAGQLCVAHADSVVSAPLLMQNFEDQIPGDAPTGWGKLWGDEGDDQIVVTNLKSASGKNSLLLDRQTSTNTKMWGFGRSLPAIEDGWYATRFAFAVDGSGSDISIGIEIRAKGGTNERACVIGVDGLNVRLSSPDWTKSTLVGAIVSGNWYRVTLWTPTAGGRQSEARALLECLQTGEWKPVGDPQTVPSTALKGGYGYFEVNTAPGKRNYKFYLDDLQVERRARP